MEDRLWTTADIGGETYSIKKMTALTGVKAARRLLTVAARVDLAAVESADTDAVLRALCGALDALDDQSAEWLVTACLQCCYKQLPAGNCPVINGNGSYGVPEAEYDIALTLRLVFEALKWSVAGFFGESAPSTDGGAATSARRTPPGLTSSPSRP